MNQDRFWLTDAQFSKIEPYLPTGTRGSLPHPSGANGERIAYFTGRKPRAQLSSRTNALSLDVALESLRAQVTGLHRQTV
jgi:hypothetical protein